MDTYIARQPIFNSRLDVVGYELLYRDASNTGQAVFVDGDAATSKLLSAAFTHFSLPNLTNYLPAYINFTESLILGDYVHMVNPKEIVIEILEDVKVTEDLINKVKVLKDEGYRIALDDYTGERRYVPLLPIVDVIKVDFMLTTEEEQRQLAKTLSQYPNITILAEKVETSEDFERAKEMGYKYFQGYFFSKPKTVHAKVSNLSATSYGQLLREINNKAGINFNVISKIIYRDALMTFRVLQRARTMEYYRGNNVTGVNQALVRMGETEVRRWIFLMVAQENNIAQSDELVRQAYLRGVFAKTLMENCGVWGDSENGFLLGMFSMLEEILGVPIEDIVEEIDISHDVQMALLGRGGDSFYKKLLDYVITYESASMLKLLPDIGLNIDDVKVAELYMQSLIETDKAFVD